MADEPAREPGVAIDPGDSARIVQRRSLRTHGNGTCAAAAPRPTPHVCNDALRTDHSGAYATKCAVLRTGRPQCGHHAGWRPPLGCVGATNGHVPTSSCSACAETMMQPWRGWMQPMVMYQLLAVRPLRKWGTNFGHHAGLRPPLGCRDATLAGASALCAVRPSMPFTSYVLWQTRCGRLSSNARCSEADDIENDDLQRDGDTSCGPR